MTSVIIIIIFFLGKAVYSFENGIGYEYNPKNHKEVFERMALGHPQVGPQRVIGNIGGNPVCHRVCLPEDMPDDAERASLKKKCNVIKEWM